MSDVQLTELLDEAVGGDTTAAQRLMPLVYDELRALAQSYLSRERPDHTLQATALVHEAFLRLVGQKDAKWKGRAHFFAVAAQAIRRILVDHARAKQRAKRGADWQRLTLDESIPWDGERDLDLVALDEALAELAVLDERQAKVVELRFFGGMTLDEVADVLGVSPRTVDSDWQMARWWLRRRIQAEAAE